MTVRFGREAPGRVLILVALFALVVAACGSAASPSPGGGGATPTPTGGGQPTATPGGGGTGSFDPGAGSALEGRFDSWDFALRMTGFGGTAASGDLVIQGTTVLRPTKALRWAMGEGADAFVYHVIGDKAWTCMGAGTCFENPDPGDIESQFESFNPETLFGDTFSSGSGMELVGTETKNGVQTQHWRADETTRNAAAAVLGLQGAEFKYDAWIAIDGGYMVSAAFGATGTVEGQAQGFEWTIDISGFNDPGNQEILTPPM